MSSELDLEISLTGERIAPPEAAAGRPGRSRRGETAVRKVLKRNRFLVGAGLPDQAAVALVIEGLKQASRHAGVSGRTLRRRFVRGGSSISGFVAAARLAAARELFARGWSTGEAAEALGYSSAAAFRRFLRQNAGVGVWSLRKRAGSPVAQ